MKEITISAMEQIHGGVDLDCATSGWVAAGLALGAFGGPLGALGGGYLGYEVCKAWNA